MAQKIARVGVKREQGWLYYMDKDGDVSRAKMVEGRGKVKTGKSEKIAQAGVVREDGYLYFLDKDGDISRTKMAQARKSKKKKPAATEHSDEPEQTTTEMPALSVRQPWAELLLRGTVSSDQRVKPTEVRGQVYLYASQSRYPAEQEAKLGQEHNLDVNALTRGKIIGTIEIADCVEGPQWCVWQYANPQRLDEPLKPDNEATPGIFQPFED